MKDDNKGWVIPMADYQPELEERVRHYVQTIPTLPRNERKPTRARAPDSSDPIEQEIWCREELRRIKDGHFGMSGKMYFWYNYVKLQDIEYGVVRPEFRVCQQYWFDEVQKAEDSREWGLIGVKRRRIGASWLEAADVLRDAIVKKGISIGMTSKTEVDAIELFKKTKWIYDNLPPWLRPTTAAGNSRTEMFFAYRTKDKNGNNVLAGAKNRIIVKAPTETSWEGTGLVKWLADEAGKIEGLKAMFSKVEPALMKGTRRVSCPLIFGTAGDITKEGADFKEMWAQSEILKLTQFFFGGWMGLDGLVDDFGNDMVEEAVRWVVYERRRRENLGIREYTDFIQQYPLTVQEAFTSNESYGVGDQFKISKQLDTLTTNPPLKKHGYFRLDSNQKPVFIPQPLGACVIYEEPDGSLQDLYVAGADSTDHEVKNPDSKNISGHAMYVMKKRRGLEPPKIVFEIFDRPKVPRDFYDQALLACLYYNQCRILIEKNKPGMITYFDENGFKHLCATKPQGYSQLIQGTTWNIGIYMDKRTKLYGEECVGEYIEDHFEWIPSKELLKECQEYGQRNTDRCFPANTQINTDYGYKKIQDIAVGDMVLTHTGTYKPVTALMYTPNHAGLVSIKVKGLFAPLICTPNHPLLLAKRQGPAGQIIAGGNWRYKNLLPARGWVEATTAQVGDYLFIPRRKNLPSTVLSEFELYLLGWYLSDGDISKYGQIRITFQGDQLHIAEYVKEQLILYDFMDIATEPITKRGHPRRKLPSIRKEPNKFCYRLTFTSKRVQKLIFDNVTPQKALKPALFCTTGLAPLVLGYFEGDGSQNIRLSKDGSYRGSLSVSSINFDMVYQVYQVLLDMGIWSTLSHVRPKSIKHKPQLRIDCQDWERVNLILEKSLKFKKFEIVRRQNKVAIEKDDGYWMPISNVSQSSFVGPVYNFEVADDHTYIAGGVAVHNCMAWMVTLIYLKEDKWEATDKVNNEKFFQKKLVKGANGIPRRISS